MQILSMLTGLVLVMIPQSVYAITLGSCPVTNLSCNSNLSVTIYNTATVFAIAFGGFLIAMFVFYGIKLLCSTGDENAQSEVRTSIAYAVFGAILVAGANILANSFAVSFAISGTIVNTSTLETGILSPVKDFITGLLSVTLIITITYQGIRLVLADDESQSSTARKRFIEGLIGAVVIILVDTIVSAFIPSVGMGNLSDEFAGISRYLATIFGLLAVIAIVSGGIFLVFSATDSYKDKGKQMIFAGIISLVVVWVSYALVKLFI